MTGGAPGRVRVVRLLRVRDGMEADFVTSYDEVRRGSTAVPGNLGEQLCRSLDDPAQWLLTSEWESFEAVRAWRTGSAHRALVEPMNACLHDDRWTAVFEVRQTTSA
ncbi:antibiotic biosynthesis monooxygenase family protein [Streptomyces sp. KAU_LT]|uniref:antibiotic biosynthesis monooxygenase family protein n=1 Tax=Streptomyces sp. KAU_LT TaxID=3046669 RepID=UPI0024B86858|nr:antibiotic biosynthesis monooxygenase family protein [Streptomyces sp. KAU_LT]MDI9831111.1 antibiotic biosynthesis monooxygenase family protein [Streptomyces sp. KAU_LT]